MQMENNWKVMKEENGKQHNGQKLTSKLMEEMMRSQFIQLVQIHYTEQHLWY